MMSGNDNEMQGQPGGVARNDAILPSIEMTNDVPTELRRVKRALEAVFAQGHHSAASSWQPPPQAPTDMDSLLDRRDVADRYLTRFQHSPIAWMVCDQMLMLDNHDNDGTSPSMSPTQPQSNLVQQRFFAAQTLHAKCRDDVPQLPSEALPSLRDSLVVHLLKYYSASATDQQNIPHALMTRLALAVSALSVQMCWTSVVPDMLQQHANANNNPSGSTTDNNSHCMALLDLFHVLPEEAVNERIMLVDETQRVEYQNALQANVPQVMEFLAQELQMLQQQQQTANQLSSSASQRNTQEKVFECVQTWLRCIRIPPQVMEHYFYILEVAFQSLHSITSSLPQDHPQSHLNIVSSVDVSEAAVDLIVEFLRVYPSHHSNNMDLIRRTIPLVMQLQHHEAHFAKPIISIPHLQFSTEEMEDAEFNDRLRAYCRIFTEMSESYMSLIVGDDTTAGVGGASAAEQADKDRAVELVLKCSAIPNREIASMTLNFWYRFVHQLENGSGGGSVDARVQQYKIDHYQPVLVSLVQVCVTTLLRYPNDVDELREDQLDDVERDRFYVADTVEDCCRLLGGHEVLRYLGERLQRECYLLQQQPSANPSSPVSTPQQQGQEQQQLQGYLGVEACLFALKGISRYIPNDENTVLPFVFGEVLTPLMLHQQQRQQERQQDLSNTNGGATPLHWLRLTVNLLLGKYAAWLAKHPQYLQPLLPYLAQSFSILECASSAATSVRQLCDFYWDPPLGEPVLQLYEQLMASSAQGRSPSTSNNGGIGLELRDELAVLEGVCKAMSRDLEYKSAADASIMFGRIVTPIGNRLTSLLANAASTSSVKQVVAEIERLTIIVRFLKTPKRNESDITNSAAPPQSETLIVELMKQSWDLLDTVTQRNPRDTNLAEKVCRLHKHAMRSCGAQAYAPMVGPLMPQLIRNFRHSYLSPYLYASSICITEYGSDPAYAPQLFHLISELSSTIFERMISLDDFTEHPDVVEEYFYLVGRFMTYCPEPLVLSPLFRKIIQRAVVGLHIHHREAHKGTLNFLETTVAFGLSMTQQQPQSNTAPAVSDACKVAFQEAIVAEGPAIVHNLAHALLGDLPSYSLDHGSGSVAGVLWKLNALCPDLVHEWIRPAVSRAPEPAKSDLMAAMTRRVSREEFNGVVRHFKSSCDRHRRIQTSTGSGSGRQA
jgi:transportin-3